MSHCLLLFYCQTLKSPVFRYLGFGSHFSLWPSKQLNEKCEIEASFESSWFVPRIVKHFCKLPKLLQLRQLVLNFEKLQIHWINSSTKMFVFKSQKRERWPNFHLKLPIILSQCNYQKFDFKVFLIFLIYLLCWSYLKLIYSKFFCQSILLNCLFILYFLFYQS